ncbi:D-alanyl-D-alanine carboxypeptidase family protein [Ferribacterium limneticum]|uniref:D-alanyl-D-alanine carboxypeptidase family protein n=1 Tax=Ferribacterium limneticum TaxID=76259 RepID=UPI001CFC20F7|nr:D-alanyl-D-alanine carboxypeptidase family protein [Ferribacterium limneticum]UCV28820.1 D-alanyl-D-alanine carboxypeptidase [Ferribacterium limneticum]UCV32738.1 D-alanyl-D-alanine carboxypeptidase [Ferribacterium limneticum]
MSLFRKTAFILLSIVTAGQVLAQQLPVPPALAAKSWLLLEVGSNQVLTAEKSDERLEPASLTKLMTAYLTFSAMRQKTIGLSQPLPVSEKAWRTGGSKMFIRVDTQVPVEDLIKGMIVQSGNDACVTLAEGIAGSEENFAQMMNREAQRLGMTNSHFMNSTGLPDPQHYTTARDLSLLASALIRDFPEDYKKYYSMKEFRYNNITQPNRNRLLFIDPTVDGVKTGHTEAAGYCLISSALRDKRRLLSVVLGTASDSARASESQKLLNWGYISYDAVALFAKDQVVATLRAWKGAQSEAKVGFTSDLSVVVPKGYANKVKSDFVAEPRLIAPIEAGQKVGTLKVSIDGKPYNEYPVVALENIALGNIFIRLIDTIRLWFN